MILFVAGNSRSGTTMMSRILSNHTDVFAFHELHCFDELLPGNTGESGVDRRQAVELYTALCRRQRGGYFSEPDDPSVCQEIADQQASLLDIRTGLGVYEKFLYDESTRNGKSVPCEQTPQNVFSMELLLRALPGSRFILMVRDPRDVLLSQKYKWKRRNLSGGKIPLAESFRSRVNYHPVLIPAIWNRVMSQVEKWKDHPSVFVVKYEDLVTDPLKTIGTICNHVGISFQLEMADIPIMGSSGSADAPGNRGIDARKSGQWKQGGLNATEIRLCEQITAPYSPAWGYPESGNRSNKILVLWYYLLLPVKLALAAVINRRRLSGWMLRLGKN